MGFDQGEQRDTHPHCAGGTRIRLRRPVDAVKADTTSDLPTTLGEGKQSQTPVDSEPDRNFGSAIANAHSAPNLDAAAKVLANSDFRSYPLAFTGSHGFSLASPHGISLAHPHGFSRSHRVSLTDSYHITNSHPFCHSHTDHNYEYLYN
ncbi:MAG TPA: hypothetical protein VNE82_24435 [Candidatus Binataceae bacterium]|nr:hypothetical protein [Candidatus Binataceae bacterium]